MADKEWIAEYLARDHEEVRPYDFYRAIFPEGELEKTGEYVTGKYTGVACALHYEDVNKKPWVRKYTLTDDLNVLDILLKMNDFVLLSPISYYGQDRSAEHARYLYAMAVDLDGIEKEGNLRDLFHQMRSKVNYIPTPTYIVWSGTGVHLYYVFERPIPCYKNVTRQLSTLKKRLTRKIWNGYVTSLEDRVQYESLFQGFRLVGGVTKAGGRTRAFLTGKPISIEYLNEYVEEEYKVIDIAYKSELTLAEAKAKYPEWYQRRIEGNAPRGKWIVNRALYDWWRGRIVKEAKTGHRYYCLMVLAIYAKKCGISEEELEEDALGLVDVMEELTDDENNHFTASDALSAMEMYNDNYFTFSVNAIEKCTDIRMEHNKRNGRKQEIHLARARAVQEFDDKMNNTNWRKGNGRKSKQAAVQEWRLKNPEGKKVDCIRETGLSKPTVYKHWNI